MVKVICLAKSNKLGLIKIRGHAGYAQKGFDIVCAGISSIIEGTRSFFKTNYSKEIVINSNRLATTFSVIDYDNESLQVCLQMFIHQLKNISHFYPNYIALCFE